MRIEDEIKQVQFRNEYHKLNINLLFTASWLSQMTTQILRPHQLSWQQFNILRILRGRYPEPASVKLLSERMIDKMSNASRLVEKLRQKGYVERIESPTDRRRVEISITELGIEVINKASEVLENETEARLSIISEAEAQQINTFLDSLRG